MRINIKDVASKAGVSITTVSLVLNDKPSRISEKTKQHVLQTAKELGYRANQTAVELKTKRSKTIGLIVSDIRNDFYSSLAKGLEDKCRENGFNVILCNTSDLIRRELEYIETLYNKGVEGIVLSKASDGDLISPQNSVDLLESYHIPHILLDLSYMGYSSNALVGDHLDGGYIATKHLLELGHRRIACVTGPTYLEGSISRLKGYQKALTEYDIPYDESLIYYGDYLYGSGFEAVETLIKNEFTAIFAFNDMMAFGVYQGLRNHNLSIPNDVSVIGYDDIFMAKMLDTPLTTMEQPFYKMGRKAGDILINISNGKATSPIIERYKPKLIIRNSTAKLNATSKK